MKKAEKEILKELIIEIRRFFPKEDVEHYKTLLEKARKRNLQLDNIDPLSKHQLESEQSSGSEIRDRVDKILSYADEQMSVQDRLKLNVSIISLMINYGEFDLATELAEALEEESKENNFDNLLAESYLLQSKILSHQSEWNDCKRFCKKAIYMFTEIGDQYGIANCENMYGAIATEKGEISEAKYHFMRALNISASLDADMMNAMLNTNLGIINDIQGNLEAAMQNYGAAEKFHLKLKDPLNLARLHHNMAMLYLKKEEYEKALEYFNKCIDISIKKGYLTNCAIAFIGKANVYAKEGKNDLSEAFVNKAVEMSLKINDRLNIADAYRIKGIIYKNLDNHELSEEYFENSLRLNDDFSNKANIAETSIEMGNLYEKMDEKEKAEELKSKGDLYYESINQV